MLTSHEVAALTRLNEKTIRRMHAAGVLVGIRVGRSPRGPLRFKVEDVEAYLAQQKGR